MSAFKVFLSSPGDVIPERDRVAAVIERLNAEHPGQPPFALTRWEQSYYSATHTFQEQIASPGEHDIVVFIFWKRLGTDLPPAYNRADGTTRTGTEYEFEEARDAQARRPDRLPDILVYRKTAKVLFGEETVDLERAQKKALDHFWERWFHSDSGHFIGAFQSFAHANDFELQFERNLREWLHRRHADHVVWDIERQGSPYRGLAPIDEKHSELFFGRDVDINRARARFIAVGQQSQHRSVPFLLILGASGCGKSSFLRAGLVPRMRAAGVPAYLEDGSDRIHAFRSVVVIPREMGEDLCRGLATALYGPKSPADLGDTGLAELAQGDYPTPESFATLASNSPASAVPPILRALDRAGTSATTDTPDSSQRWGLLLAIDQLEELFARPDADRQAFVRLLAALTATGRVWIAATMRNDFYARLRQDPDLSALTDRGRIYDLAPPSVGDYRAIIRQTAQAAGLRFEVSEQRDLAKEIEAEAGSEGALPMVAFLLEQLFQERRGNELTLETYDRLGGAAGALARRGDELFESLPTAVQDAFPRVGRRLVRKSLQDLAPTATSVPVSVFLPGSPEAQLMDVLLQARLVGSFTVSADGEHPATWVRWSHEALLTRWPRLRISVDTDRHDYETLDRVQSAFSLWQSTPAEQQTQRLLADLALLEAEDLMRRWGADVDAPVKQFVQVSSQQARLRRRRRRRRTTATVAALAVLLVVATVMGFVAFRQRNLAFSEQAAADRTSRFMVSLFELADPGASRGNSITVREVLDRGARDVGNDMQDSPGIRADLLTAMGQAYSGLGLYDPAKGLLARARADQDRADVPAESRVRTLLASGATLYLAGDYEQAEKLLRDAVARARSTLPSDNVLRSEALDRLAEVLVQLDKIPEAEQLCQEALAADRKRGPEQAAVLARTLDALGSVHFYDGNLQAAEADLREALNLHERTLGSRHAQTAQSMNNLAAVLYQSGRYAQAMTLYQQALPLYREVYGAEHPEVASILNNLGRSALMAGRVTEAEPMLRQTLAMTEKLKGPTHDDLVSPLNSLAMIDGFTGRLERARAEISRAEQIARLPNHGVLLDQVLLNAADLHLRQGELAQGAESLTESRRLLEAAFPLAGHPSDAWRYAVWDTVNAELTARRGDVPAAQRAAAAALPIIARRWGTDGFHTVLARQRARAVDEQARSNSNKL